MSSLDFPSSFTSGDAGALREAAEKSQEAQDQHQDGLGMQPAIQEIPEQAARPHRAATRMNGNSMAMANCCENPFGLFSTAGVNFSSRDFRYCPKA